MDQPENFKTKIKKSIISSRVLLKLFFLYRVSFCESDHQICAPRVKRSAPSSVSHPHPFLQNYFCRKTPHTNTNIYTNILSLMETGGNPKLINAFQNLPEARSNESLMTLLWRKGGGAVCIIPLILTKSHSSSFSTHPRRTLFARIRPIMFLVTFASLFR